MSPSLPTIPILSEASPSRPLCANPGLENGAAGAYCSAPAYPHPCPATSSRELALGFCKPRAPHSVTTALAWRCQHADGPGTSLPSSLPQPSLTFTAMLACTYATGYAYENCPTLASQAPRPAPARLPALVRGPPRAAVPPPRRAPAAKPAAPPKPPKRAADKQEPGNKRTCAHLNKTE